MSDLIVLQQTRAFADAIDQSLCDGCDGCGARCVAGVPMLHLEFTRIREYLAGSAGMTARAVERQEKVLPYPGTSREDGAFYQACRFRDVERGRCAIYPVRPLVCRLFGYVDWLPCPIEKVGAVPGGLEVMGRYADATQKSYEDWLAEEGGE